MEGLVGLWRLQSGWALTRERFGSWLLYKSSCSDHLHLQLTLFLHHTDLDIT